MNAAEYVIRQFGLMRRLLDGTVGDLTEEQVNWRPPGTANSIGSTLVHLFGSEDQFVQSVILEQPTIWERDGWQDRIGVTKVPERGVHWEKARQSTLELAPLLEYGKAVCAATDAYLAGVIDADLDKSVTLAGNERQAADVLVLAVVHNVCHTGDIAALKGAHGAKGLPF